MERFQVVECQGAQDFPEEVRLPLREEVVETISQMMVGGDMGVVHKEATAEPLGDSPEVRLEGPGEVPEVQVGDPTAPREALEVPAEQQVPWGRMTEY
jgi:hypothetical protein